MSEPIKTPAEGGEQTFTQAEVDAIVSREKAKAAAKALKESSNNEDYKAQYEALKQELESGAAEREQVLKARENRIECREYLDTKGYPAELLDILDSADIDKFKSSADQIAGLFKREPKNVTTMRVSTGIPLSSSGTYNGDVIANAFKPKI